MPATLPSHAAAVLPLKLWRPRRFDGVALVVGSAAPDLAYPLAGLVSLPETHTLLGLFWFCLPVTMAVAWLLRRAAPVVAAHLPPLPAALALNDYAVLGRVRHPWRVTAWSALLGATSHLVWDGFTHDPHGHGWPSRQIAELQRDGLFGLPWWTVTDHASTAIGAAAALACAVHIGRRRLLREWHGPPPAAVARAPRLFWSVAAAVAALYPLTWPLLPYPWSPHVQGVRMLWAVGLGFLAGAAAVTAADRAGWRGERVPDRTRHDG